METMNKSGKFMGYCYGCETMIASFDIKGAKFTCQSCGKSGSIKRLLKVREPKLRVFSKYVPANYDGPDPSSGDVLD